MFIYTWNQDIQSQIEITCKFLELIQLIFLAFSYIFSFAFLNFYVYIISILYCPSDQELNEDSEILKSVYQENERQQGEFAALTGDNKKIWQQDNDEIEDVDLDEKENRKLKNKEEDSDDEDNQFGEQERAIEEDYDRKNSDDISEKEKKNFTIEISSKNEGKEPEKDLL